MNLFTTVFIRVWKNLAKLFFFHLHLWLKKKSFLIKKTFLHLVHFKVKTVIGLLKTIKRIMFISRVILLLASIKKCFFAVIIFYDFFSASNILMKNWSCISLRYTHIVICKPNDVLCRQSSAEKCALQLFFKHRNLHYYLRKTLVT